MQDDPVTLEFCKSLPKVELHAHLNGSVPMKTLLDLAREQKKDFSSETFLLVDRGDRSLEECFKLFDVVYQLTQEDETVYRITKDVIQSFAEDNVKYVELRTTPKQSTTRTKDTYIQAVLKAVEECNANEELDIITKILVSIDRRTTLEDAEDTVDLALRYKDKGVVGLDWCGNPSIGKFSTFLPTFQRGRDQGLKITLHFAEVDEPDNVGDIIKFKPERIGHATVLSKEAADLLKKDPIPMEICFTSNLLCKTVLEGPMHHFGEYYSAGYPLIICTDDKGVFGSTLSNEYFLISRAFNLSKNQLLRIAQKAGEFIFCDHSRKLIASKLSIPQ